MGIFKINIFNFDRGIAKRLEKLEVLRTEGLNSL